MMELNNVQTSPCGLRGEWQRVHVAGLEYTSQQRVLTIAFRLWLWLLVAWMDIKDNKRRAPRCEDAGGTGGKPRARGGWSTGALGEQGAVRVAATGREPVMKGLTCQTKDGTRLGNSQGSHYWVFSGMGTPCGACGDSLKCKPRPLGAASAQSSHFILRKLLPAAACGGRVAQPGLEWGPR